jgi:ribosomal protein L40E
MDKETANYIVTYFGNLMADDEKLAIKSYMYSFKASDNPNQRSIMIDKGWISTKPEILELLNGGYDEFELNVAKRIMAMVPEKVYLNNCPICKRLARTPHAKQCRHCGHNWHDKLR